MSDPLSELPLVPRPKRAPTWRERLAEWAEALDLTPTRLAVGAVALVVAGLVGWKLLAPPEPPPEMRLPFVSTTVSAAPSAPSTTGAEVGGENGESAAAELVVHVAGAVAAPGVHRLAGDARVIDAVEAAGGALADADLGRLNLAAPLEDGQQVYLPRVGEQPPVGVPGAGGVSVGSSGSGSPGSGPDAPVDLNTATADELDALPGVGPSIAQAIVAYREEHGRFTSVDQLIDVRGIGEAKLAELRPLVAV